MKRILVWDLPTRLLHWLLAGSMLSAFAIATLTDDDGAAFSLHALLGLVAAMVVALRLVWGLVGTRYARLSSFPASPAALVTYLRSALTGAAQRFAGHNPGSAWAAAVIFACTLGLGATGLLMSGGSEAAEEIHEVLAWTMIAAVVAHLAGIALHTLRHREPIGLSMVHGRKDGDPAAAIPSARPAFGLVALALTGAWAGALWTGYDARSGAVTVLGATIGLAEQEEEGHHDDDDD